MHALDWLVAAVYLGGVVAFGTWLGRRQQGATDYFLGRRDLPWWAVLVSVVATETSALTVISVPGIGFQGIHLTMGLLIFFGVETEDFQVDFHGGFPSRSVLWADSG